MECSKSKNGLERLSRDEWLARALEVVASEGGAKLRVENLVKMMGVTTGSFYWHFKNRDDFVQSLAEFWADWSTQQIIDELRKAQVDAKDRLHALARLIMERKLTKYELVIRSWATQENEVAKVVKRVDENRLAFVRGLFADLGFKNDDLEMRAQAFAVLHSLESGFLASACVEDHPNLLRRRLDFFTARSGCKDEDLT